MSRSDNTIMSSVKSRDPVLRVTELDSLLNSAVHWDPIKYDQRKMKKLWLWVHHPLRMCVIFSQKYSQNSHSPLVQLLFRTPRGTQLKAVSRPEKHITLLPPQSQHRYHSHWTHGMTKWIMVPFCRGTSSLPQSFPKSSDSAFSIEGVLFRFRSFSNLLKIFF